MSILEIEGLVGGYGMVEVLHGIDMSLEEGAVVAVLGANGAGKTSLLRAISGELPKATGSIRFDGQEIVDLATDKIAQLGICHVPEGRGTFVELTVAENLEVGAWRRDDRSNIDSDREHMFGLFPVLAERRKQRAGELSGGEQQMLAVARALMGSPRLLLLDEPSLGLAPLIVKSVYESLGQAVAETGVTSLVVEQSANVALKLASHAHLLEVGQIIRSGTSDEFRNDDEIRRSYLGA